MSLEPGDEAVNTLYKYRPANDHTIELLSTQQAYFAYPDEFNDPFDCKVPIDLSGSEQDMRAWASRLPIPESQKVVIYESFKRGLMPTNTIVKKAETGLYRLSIVYCLAGSPNNLLLWSHYASAHTGICIAFGVEVYLQSLCIRFDDPALKNLGALYMDDYLPTSKVHYSGDRPQAYSIFRGSADDIRPFLITKSKEWSYEEERRIVVPHSNLLPKKIRLHKSSIKSVCFGANITETYKKRVVDVLREEFWTKSYPVKIYQAVCSSTKYELDLIEQSIS